MPALINSLLVKYEALKLCLHFPGIIGYLSPVVVLYRPQDIKLEEINKEYSKMPKWNILDHLWNTKIITIFDIQPWAHKIKR